MKKVTTEYLLWPWEFKDLLPDTAYGFTEVEGEDYIIYYIDTYVSEWEI